MQEYVNTSARMGRMGISVHMQTHVHVCAGLLIVRHMRQD